MCRPKAAAFASRSTGETTSTLFYKAFDPWAANADWYLTVPAGEEVRCPRHRHSRLPARQTASLTTLGAAHDGLSFSRRARSLARALAARLLIASTVG